MERLLTQTKKADYNRISRYKVEGDYKTEFRKLGFLNSFKFTGNVSLSAERSGVPISLVYSWKNKDTDFKMNMELAANEAVERMEAEAHRRAVSGTEEGIYYRGKKVGTIRKYSDTLLIFLLKARRPEIYREAPRIERYVQKSESSTSTPMYDMNKLSLKERLHMKELIEKSKVAEVKETEEEIIVDSNTN